MTNPIADSLNAAFGAAQSEAENRKREAEALARRKILVSAAESISLYVGQVESSKDKIVEAYKYQIVCTQVTAKQPDRDHTQYVIAVLQDIARYPLSFPPEPILTPIFSNKYSPLTFSLGHTSQADDVHSLMKENATFNDAIQRLLDVCRANDFAVSIHTRNGFNRYDEFVEKQVSGEAEVEIKILPGMTFAQSEVPRTLEGFIKPATVPAAAPAATV
jgi:hypothetical protein